MRTVLLNRFQRKELWARLRNKSWFPGTQQDPLFSTWGPVFRQAPNFILFFGGCFSDTHLFLLLFQDSLLTCTRLLNDYSCTKTTRPRTLQCATSSSTSCARPCKPLWKTASRPRSSHHLDVCKRACGGLLRPWYEPDQPWEEGRQPPTSLCFSTRSLQRPERITGSLPDLWPDFLSKSHHSGWINVHFWIFCISYNADIICPGSLAYKSLSQYIYSF